MTTMVTISELESQVLEQEGVILNVKRKPLAGTYTAPSHVPSYVEKYPTRIKDDASFRVLVNRLRVILPQLSFFIVRGNGYPVRSKNMPMGDIRKTMSLSSSP